MQVTLPRLAVIIPCYNAAAWIDHTIRSVLEQEYENLVLIVVDDGSTDASVERVKAFGEDVILLTGPNRGASHARNQGLRIAHDSGADYVLFLDADDYLEGENLHGGMEVAVGSGADMVLSDMHRIEFDGRREERFLYSGRVEPEVFFVIGC